MGQRTHSTASLAYHRMSARADVPISRSEDNIVRLTAAIQPHSRLPARYDGPDYTDSDHVGDQDHSPCSVVRLRPDSPNSDISTRSRRSNAKLFDIVRRQEEAALERERRQDAAALERERIQAQVVAQQAEIALERERIQAQATSQQTQAMIQAMLQLAKQNDQTAKELAKQNDSTMKQSIQLIGEVIQSLAPHSSAWPSRRTSQRPSREHSPDHRSEVEYSREEHESDQIQGKPDGKRPLNSCLEGLTVEQQKWTMPPHSGHNHAPPSSEPAHVNLSSSQIDQQPPAPAPPSVAHQWSGPTQADIVTSPLNRQLSPENYQTPVIPVPPNHRPVLPYVAPPTFPDFKVEDRAQYLELRMCLDSLLTDMYDERYKYAILLQHVKVPRARMMISAFGWSDKPYSESIAALDDRYGRPWDFILTEISVIEKLPPVRDNQALEDLFVKVQNLVGMLKCQGEDGFHELNSSSNVKRILEKLPPFRQERFRRLQNRLHPDKPGSSLIDLAAFLKDEVRSLSLDTLLPGPAPRDKRDNIAKSQGKPTTIMHTTGEPEREQLKASSKGGTEFSFCRLTAKVSIVCLIDTVGEDRTTVGLRYRLLVGEKSAFRRTSSLTGLDSSTSPLLAPPRFAAVTVCLLLITLLLLIHPPPSPKSSTRPQQFRSVKKIDKLR
ncbi:uncharacterized protein V6R79_003046 [Siganus canaliculatus]